MNLKKIFSFLFIVVTTLSFAQEENLILDEKFSALDMIMDNFSSCVKEVNENKLYIWEDRIYPSEQGLFLRFRRSRPLRASTTTQFR